MRSQLVRCVLTVGLLLLSASSFAELPNRLEGRDVVTDRPSETRFEAAETATVVAFLSAKCPCSASHEVALRNLQSEFGKKGFQFVGIHSNLDESPESTKAHFATTALPFPVVSDDGQKYADAFRALKTPHVFVVAKNGSLLFQGGIDESQVHGNAKKHYLRDALVAITEKREPPVKEARTLGCVIRR